MKSKILPAIVSGLVASTLFSCDTEITNDNSHLRNPQTVQVKPNNLAQNVGNSKKNQD